jgi:spore germination cell wall hydrolase CwlJ-like protein
MLYSQQIATVNVAKTWKVLIAALSVIFIWQIANTQSLANATVTSSEVTKPANTEVPNPEPTQTPQERFMEQWRNAKFLTVVDTPERINYTDEDLFCMAKNIYHEAGNQSRLGKFAVAQVTINRVKHPLWRDTVCGVVFEPYQFSWANNRSIRWTTPRSSEMWRESREVAREVLSHGFRVKGMEEAVYYHANYVSPNWRNVDRLVRIGAHIFYERA